MEGEADGLGEGEAVPLCIVSRLTGWTRARRRTVRALGPVLQLTPRLLRSLREVVGCSGGGGGGGSG